MRWELWAWGQRGPGVQRQALADRRAARRCVARRWVWSEDWGAWYWNNQWWSHDWYVWNGYHWLERDYWCGLGRSCDEGRCCRMCPHGYQLGRRNLGGKCFLCGDDGCCRGSNCGHPCCEQVSPGHVAKRLQKVLSKGDVLGGMLGSDVLLKIAEFIIDYPQS